MMRKGFTLIELLIVVAIIAILAAIAVPNFLEAQTRSKVSRVKADQRSLSVAIESYKIDWNYYPSACPSEEWPGYEPSGPGREGRQGQGLLTAPTAYITSVPHDPFGGVYQIGLWAEDSSGSSSGAMSWGEWGKWYYYEDRWPGLQFWGGGLQHGRYYPNSEPVRRRPPPGPGYEGYDGVDVWCLVSVGPSRKWYWPNNQNAEVDAWQREYDPTNGSRSYGSICRWGP